MSIRQKYFTASMLSLAIALLALLGANLARLRGVPLVVMFGLFGLALLVALTAFCCSLSKDPNRLLERILSI